MRRWLRCEVGDGMFSDERTILVRVKGNGTIEHFVPQQSVRTDYSGGRVEVNVIERPDGLWAQLPTPYRRTIPVDADQLTLA